MSAEPNYYLPRDRECELGVEMNCRKYEECVSQSTAGNRRRSGICECTEGYVRNEVGYCVRFVTVFNAAESRHVLTIATFHFRRDISAKYDATPSSSQPIRPNSDSNATSNRALKPLLVSVASKTVQLPEDEVTLSAYVVPPGGKRKRSAVFTPITIPLQSSINVVV